MNTRYAGDNYYTNGDNYYTNGDHLYYDDGLYMIKYIGNKTMEV